MQNIQKIMKVVLILIILAQFIGLVIAYAGFSNLANTAGFVSGQVHERLAKVDPEGLTVIQFMKDLCVNLSLYAGCTGIFILAAVAGVIIYISFLLKSRQPQR